MQNGMPPLDDIIKLVTAIIVLVTALLKLWDQWNNKPPSQKPPSQKPPSADGGAKTEPTLDPARTTCLVTATGPTIKFWIAKPLSLGGHHKTG